MYITYPILVNMCLLASTVLGVRDVSRNIDIKTIENRTKPTLTKHVDDQEVDMVQYFTLNEQERVTLFMSDVLTVSINYSLPCENKEDSFRVKVMSSDTEKFSLEGNTTFLVSCSKGPLQRSLTNTKVDSTQGTLKVIIKAGLLGVAELKITVSKFSGSDVTSTTYQNFQVFVLRKLRVIDLAFRYVIAVFMFVVFIAFGCKLDLDVVKECLKKPIAPGIGLACQYLIMPLLGYGIAVLVPVNDKSIRLGIFLCGVCPGGGASNIYSYLLGGDVSLSITMTFISTIASIGFMPLWIYTLGRTLMDERINLTIPFVPLVQTIALATIPVLIGVLIKYKFVKAAKLIIKVLKPVTLLFILLFVVIGIISNWDLFKLFKPMYIVSGCLLPYLGFLIGGIIPLILRQSWTRVKTIAIEAGMQNVGVAFVLLISSFPPPLGDVATLAPAANGMMTPIPGLLVAIPYTIYRKCQKKYDPVEMSDTDQEKEKPSLNEEKLAIEKLSTV